MMTVGEVRRALEGLRGSIPLMTVGELRKAIAGLPDDRPVMLCVEPPTPARGVVAQCRRRSIAVATPGSAVCRSLDPDQGRRLDHELVGPAEKPESECRLPTNF
jgi:hypothetical protein